LVFGCARRVSFLPLGGSRRAKPTWVRLGATEQAEMSFGEGLKLSKTIMEINDLRELFVGFDEREPGTANGLE